MPQGPAARVGDPVAHSTPPMLGFGVGSNNVWINEKPAWRGVLSAIARPLQMAKQSFDQSIRAAEAATAAATGPAYPAAKAAEEQLKATVASTMGSMINSAAGNADIHQCGTPLPIPPHGPGVVIHGSTTVFINGQSACRQGDTILEAIGPPNKIASGFARVLIGG